MLKIGEYNSMRKSILGIKGNIICSSCNNSYNKHYEHDNISLCYFCYVLRNIGFLFNNLIVCTSKYSQNEIINELYNLIKVSSTMPSLKLFKDLHKTDISILEFCRILQNNPERITNMKLVIMFDTNTSILNAGFEPSLFDSDDDI